MGELCVNCGIGTRHYCAACSSEFARSNLDPVIDQRDEARRGLREMHIAADRFLRERDEARADAARWKDEVNSAGRRGWTVAGRCLLRDGRVVRVCLTRRGARFAAWRRGGGS